MEILIVHPDKRASQLLAVLIEGNFAGRVTVANYLQGAIDLLTANKDFKLVIYTFQDERHELFKKFLGLKQNIPSLLITEADVEKVDQTFDKDLLDNISQLNLIENTCQTIQKQLESNKLQIGEAPKDSASAEYCRIPPEILMEASPLEAPIFFKLNEKKFIRIFNNGDNFNQEDLDRYSTQKKIEYFFLKKEDTSLFINRFSKILSNYIEKTIAGEDLSTELTLDLTISSHEVIQELSSKFGYNDDVKALINQNVELTVQSMKNMPNIQDLLDRMKKEQNRYINAHSTITAFIACAMSKSMNYASEATYQKLIMAAHLHDITMINHDLAMIRNTEELETMKDQFTPEEISAHEQHPKLAADISRTVAEKIPDVDTIILQHHEFGDDHSFPNKLSSMQVSPLAAVFIIAHEFVLCSIEGSLSNPEMLKMLKEKFSKGNFKQVFKQINTEQLLQQCKV